MAANNVYGRIPLFSGKNYPTWRAQMEAVLHRARLLNYCTGKTPRPEEAGANQQSWDEKDLDARAEILLAIEPSIVNIIKNFKTSKEIWDYLDRIYERKGPRQKIEEFRKLLHVKMEPEKSMEDYVREFKGIINRLSELNSKIDEDFLVILLLDGLSDMYKDVQAAFDAQSQYPPLDTVFSRLLEVGDRRKECGNPTALKVKFWNKRWRKWNGKRATSGYFPYKCRKCGIKGHMAKDCRTRTENAKAVVLKDDTESECNSEYGFITKECLNKSLQNIRNIGRVPMQWCLDSGASSHMCGVKSLFTNLTEYTEDNFVKLANDQLVRIYGIGTITLRTGEGNEIKPFETLYVPDLKENLISVSKATHNNCKVVFDKNRAYVFNRYGKLLLTAEKSNNLYVMKQMEQILKTKNLKPASNQK